MKKFAITLMGVCLALACVFAAGCNLFAPKVAGSTYEFSEVKYETDDTLTSTERAMVEGRVATYRTSETGKKIIFSNDGKVTYKNALGNETVRDYTQSGVNILVKSGPYLNTNYNGEVVCGYTITKSSKDVLNWYQTFTLMDTGTNHTFTVYMTYNIVETTDTAE